MKYGSTKQIEWAERIKSALTWDNVNSHPIIDKAKELILSNDDAAWWIDNRNQSGYTMIYMMLTTGFCISNRGNAKLAKIRTDGTAIDITWTEIVSDGKGGYKKNCTETITV